MKLGVAQRDVLLDTFGKNKETATRQMLLGFKSFVESECYLEFLEKSWNKLLEAHDSLRIEHHRKKQKILPYRYEKLNVINVAGEEGFIKIQEDMVAKPKFEDNRLSYATLVDCGNGSGGIIIFLHHLCADGYSLELMMRQFESSYKALFARKSIEFKSTTFIEYLKSEENYLKSDEFRNDLTWWEKKYRNQKRYAIPAGRQSNCMDVDIIQLAIDGEMYISLKNLCRKSKCSLPSALMTGIAITTGNITGKDNFALFNLCHGRNTWKEKQMVGCLVKTIPVFYKLMPEESFSEAIKRNYLEYLEHLQHGRIPFAYHIRMSYPKSVRCGFCFQHNWFNFSYMELEQIESHSDMGISVLNNQLQRGIFYCAAGEIRDQKKIVLKLCYQKEKFGRDKVEKYIMQYKKILTWALANSEKSLGGEGGVLKCLRK